MYNETFLNKIVSQSSYKINHIALSKLDVIFVICLVTTTAAIITGIAINIHYHNLFY